jgi:hypothetical protein
MRLYLLLFSFVITQSVIAQTPDYTKDVQSVDAIIAALYEVISGASDQPRDWERFKNLFAEDARLVPTFKDREGKTGYRIITPAAYSESFARNIKTGFYEGEVSRITEEYGNIVHVFSTYETREKKDGPVTMRGINSIQLLRQADGYRILHIFWSAETTQTPLPEKYLKK